MAATIGNGILDRAYVNNTSIAAALIGAMMFSLMTWGFRLPSSSSHALIGGLIGVGLVQAGVDSLQWPMIFIIFSSVFISPLLGMGIAILLIKLLKMSRWKNSNGFNKLQICSSALLSLGHGGNDAQKTMGIIAIMLFSNGYLGDSYYVPMWVIFACYTMIAMGTLYGGWRIIETVGYKITPLKPPSGTCAELGAASTLFIANHLGIPISTTHVLTGAVIGVGAHNPKAYETTAWDIVRKIFAAWIFTFPLSALFAALLFLLLERL